MVGDSDKLHWSVDSFTVRDGTLFAFGWLFHEDLAIRGIAVRATTGPHGEQWRLTADHGKTREDVAHAFPAYATATHSGFVVVGSCWEVGTPISDLSLAAEAADGSVLAVQIPLSSVRNFADSGDGRDLANPAFSQWTALARRGLGLLRAGRFSILFEKMRRYLGGRPKARANDPSVPLRRARASGASSYCLIVDHDLGGGANQYREQLVSERIAAGGAVAILSYHLPTLSYKLALRGTGLDESYAVPGLDVVTELAQALPVSEVICNTAVSLARPQDIPPLLVALKEATGARLLLMVHDFFMVCPSHFLLDAQGAFCGVPDESTCRVCLQSNSYGFTSLFRERDIAVWRAQWGRALARADEIRFFSEGTQRWFRKAYPDCDFAHATVIPHAVDQLRFEKLQPTFTQALRIGVIGHIGYHKGASVVASLAEEIRRRGTPIQIAVLGTIETYCDPAVLRETGAYKRDELPELVRKFGVNVILFPSICWETFSYVVQEAIELDLPVACFDLGAPAERLSGYEKGLVLKTRDPGLILDALIEFHHKIYPEG